MFKRKVFAKAAESGDVYMRLSIPEYDTAIYLRKSKTAGHFYNSFHIGPLGIELDDDVPGNVTEICWENKKVYPVKAI